MFTRRLLVLACTIGTKCRSTRPVFSPGQASAYVWPWSRAARMADVSSRETLDKPQLIVTSHIP